MMQQRRAAYDGDESAGPRSALRRPFRAFADMLNDGAQDVRGKILVIYALLAGLQIVAWGAALAAFSTRPLLLGTALLAYGFGLRHAVDADHISAIDNVTRKLMQEGKRPVALGLCFSLGHSTIVVLLSVVIAIAASLVRDRLPGLQSVGGVIGTALSAAFLLVIATINLLVFLEIARVFAQARRGERPSEASVDVLLSQGGLLGRLFRPLLRVAGGSWQMYPIGLLFGLGFDTATEVGLLGIAAVEAGKGLPVIDILIFPLLFTAGMSIIDTTDGILMIGAYGWAFVKPMRKLYYNMVITLVSVLVALVVGGIEALGLVAAQAHLEGPLWSTIANVNDNFSTLGFAIAGIFIVSWGISTLIYRWKRYDECEPSGVARDDLAEYGATSHELEAPVAAGAEFEPHGLASDDLRTPSLPGVGGERAAVSVYSKYT
jgi:high-affinity nickel-transport protein